MIVRLDPRQQILAFWEAVARFSFRDGAFVWGSTDAGNSISDAEQLLCILLPAMDTKYFQLELPDQAPDDVRRALQFIGKPDVLPQRLAQAQIEYHLRYRDEQGEAVFPSGDYAPAAQIEVVEAFAAGMRLSLTSLAYCRMLRHLLDDDTAAQLNDLARTRLNTAMISLLRSFAVRSFTDTSPSGAALRRLIAQEGRADDAVRDELTADLRETRAALYEISIPQPLEAIPPDLRFECGWTWGVVEGNPAIDTSAARVRQPQGSAIQSPDTYFTLIALEAITDLMSQRTRVMMLLDEEQQRLSRALQLRFDLSRSFWSALATFGPSWPLEHLPWDGLDGTESDYSSLVVAAITEIDLMNARGRDIEFDHLHRVLARIAVRHGIITPPRADGGPAAVRLSAWPVALDQQGAYQAVSLPALLFDITTLAALDTSHDQLRRAFTDLADLVWEHISGNPDQASAADLLQVRDGHGPRWHDILRIVSGMTRAMSLIEDGHRSTQPLGFVHQLVTEAATALEQLPEDDRADIASRLIRARRMIDTHPARAAALLFQIHADLDATTLPQ